MDPKPYSEIIIPVLGNSRTLGIVITTHVFFALMAIGGFVISVVSEYLGYTRQKPEFERMGKGMMTFISTMVKLNGVLGVIFLILLGLFPIFAEWLYLIFFWPFITEAIFFLVIMVSSIIYRETWERFESRKPTHIAIGIGLALVVTIPAWINNAVWAFMLTPGKYFETKKLADAFFNPTFLPSTLHIFIAAVLNATTALILFAYIQRYRNPQEQAYYDFVGRFNSRIVAIGILLLPPDGLLYLLKIHRENPTIFHNIISGIASPFFWTMFILGMIAFTLAIIYLILGWERGRTFILIAGLLMYIAFPIGAYNREKARKPYLIYGVMYMTEKVVTPSPVASPSRPEQKTQVIPKTGDDIIQEHNCRVCHTIKGSGGTVGPKLNAKNIKSRFHGDKEKIKQFLLSPPGVMPPFDGSPAEREILADYLLQLE